MEESLDEFITKWLAKGELKEASIKKTLETLTQNEIFTVSALKQLASDTSLIQTLGLSLGVISAIRRGFAGATSQAQPIVSIDPTVQKVFWQTIVRVSQFMDKEPIENGQSCGILVEVETPVKKVVLLCNVHSFSESNGTPEIGFPVNEHIKAQFKLVKNQGHSGKRTRTQKKPTKLR